MLSVIALIRSFINRILAFLLHRSPGPVIVPGDLPEGGEVVCYYGCPNSKKAKKLQLSKKAYK